MNAEKQLQNLIQATDLTYDQKVHKMLELGLNLFGLGIALVSRVEGDVYTVIYANSPGDMIEPGTTFPVGDTYCCHTLLANTSLGFHHAGKSEIATHPCYSHFSLESYIGAPITDGKKVVGTVNFSAAAARDPFNEEEFQFIEMLAKWLSK